MGGQPQQCEAAPTQTFIQRVKTASDICANAKLCVICLDAPKTHLLLPCGHKCVCAGCAPDFASNDDGWKRVGTPQCPICRGSVPWVARVWA